MPSELNPNDLFAKLISDNITAICTKLAEKAKDRFKKEKIDFGFAFSQYLHNAFEKYSKIKTLIYKSEPKYLYDFFECNTLSNEHYSLQMPGVQDIADISHFVIVEGTGGIGKSTLMRHFFLNTIEETDLIPILIELRDINGSKQTLLDLVFHNMARLGFTLEKKYLQYAMESGCFLFLLDGYDEVSASLRSELKKELDALCDQYSQNYYILSSRPNDSFISHQRFSVLKCQPFSKQQAISLIQKIDYDPELKQRFMSQLDEKLYESHQSFASNPLLLNIMLLTFDSYAQIPEKLHIFYANAFETLYFKHDATKSGYKREMYSPLPADIFKKIFTDFCFRTFVKTQVQFSEEEFCHELQAISHKQTEPFAILPFIDDLLYSICLIYLDGLHYRFTHRSFQEYFAALYIKNLSDQQFQRVCLHLIDEEYWQDSTILDLLYEMAQERFEQNVLIPVLEEIESKVTTDRYHTYFQFFTKFIYISKEESSFLLLDDYSGDDRGEYLKRFINTFYPLEQLQVKQKRFKKTDKLIEAFSADLTEDLYVIKIPASKITDNKALQNMMKNSAIDLRIKAAMQLYEQLKIKHSRDNSELEELLSL